MASSVSFPAFQPQNEDFVSYTERMEQHFIAQGVTDEGKQKAVLLSSCGTQTYQLMRNLVAPDRPSTKTLAQLIKPVKGHHQPHPSMIVQRLNFHSYMQIPDNKVTDFVA